MNLTDYQRAAARTSRAKRITLDVDLARLLNGVMGQAGELREFRYDPSIDEAGDVLWYCAEICSAIGVSLDAWPDAMVGDDPQWPWLAIAAEGTKKHLLHGKDATPSTLRRTVSCVMARLDRSWSLEAVAAANIAKLRARYPDGFVEGGGVR